MLPLLQRRPELWTDPARELEREFLNRLWNEGNGRREAGAYPVDIYEDQGHVYIEAEMPGFQKDDINLTLEQGVLTLEAERREEEKSGQQHLGERRFHRVQRSFTLPSSVDESNVDAKLENGVLYLTLNKREEVKPRRIEVK